VNNRLALLVKALLVKALLVKALLVKALLVKAMLGLHCCLGHSWCPPTLAHNRIRMTL